MLNVRIYVLIFYDRVGMRAGGTLRVRRAGGGLVLVFTQLLLAAAVLVALVLLGYEILLG